MATDLYYETKVDRWARRLFAAVLILVGLALAVGGIMLIGAGGSFYHLVTGLVVTISGVLILRRNRRGTWPYGATLVGTLAWSLWEIGFEPWELIPRIVAPFVLGLCLLLPSVHRIGGRAPVLRSIGGWPAFGGGLLAALLVGASLDAVGPAKPAVPLWQTGTRIAAPARLTRPPAAIGGGEWGAYDQGGTRFSPLGQISASNAANFKVTWQADTGLGPAGASTGGLEVTSIVVGGSDHMCNCNDDFIAYDTEPGRPRWRFAVTNSASAKPCRGVAHYRVPSATAACAEPNHAQADLVAIDRDGTVTRSWIAETERLES